MNAPDLTLVSDENIALADGFARRQRLVGPISSRHGPRAPVARRGVPGRRWAALAMRVASSSFE